MPLRPFGRRRPPSSDDTMDLMDHLYELRRRMFVAAVGLFAGSVIGFVWYAVGIPAIGLPSLGELLIAPYCAVPSPPRVELAGAGSCTLLATGPFSILQIRLKAALLAGVVLSAPIWLSQLWGFVTPALHRHERRFARVFGAAGSGLFTVGAILAYLVIQEGLTVLLSFGGGQTVAALSPDSYFPFLFAMLLIFGVSFELPLLLVMLNRAGLVTGARLSRSRRYAMFGLVVFAGLVVPGNDPITMLALAGSLCLLFEVAVQIARLHDRRKGKRLGATGPGSVPDDQFSPLDTTAWTLPPVEPVADSFRTIAAGHPEPTASQRVDKGGA